MSKKDKKIKVKKSFVLYNDSLDVLDDMSTEEVACMFVAIRDYNNGKEPELLDSLRFLFKQFQNQFDRDHEKWVTTCTVRALAGAKGGKQKAANASNCKQKVASVAILADNDNDNVTDSDTVNDNVTDTKSDIQLRAEKLFRRGVNRALDKSEASAWNSAKSIAEDMTEEEWIALEKFYAAPQRETFSRKSFATMLNNLSGEVQKAEEWCSTQAKQFAPIEPKHTIYK